MTRPSVSQRAARIRAAVEELKTLILQHLPGSTFEVSRGYDPEGIYVKTYVDTDDPDALMDVVAERLLEMQIDEGLPVYVLTILRSQVGVESAFAMAQRERARRAG